jgi:hypothetical protein
VTDQVGRALPPTQPMTASLPPAAVAPAHAGRNAAWTATTAFVGLLAVAALVMYLTTRDGDPATREPTASSVNPAAATIEVDPATTIAPTTPVTTVAPTTVPPTTVTPTTAPSTTAPLTTVPPTTLPETPDETREQLLAIADASGEFGDDEGRRSPRNRLEEHLDEAIEIAADGDDDDRADDVEKRLKDAAELIDQSVDGETEAEMLALIAHLADQLDVEPPDVDDD